MAFSVSPKIPFKMLMVWNSSAFLTRPSRVLVLGSKEAEEVEAEQNLEIVFRLLIDFQGWGEVVWKVVQGVTQVGVAH